MGRMLGHDIRWHWNDPPRDNREWVQCAKRREEREWRRELPDEIYDPELWEFFYHSYSGYFLKGTELEPDLWLYRGYQQELWLQELGACDTDMWPTWHEIDGNMVMWSKG